MGYEGGAVLKLHFILNRYESYPVKSIRTLVITKTKMLLNTLQDPIL